MLSSLKVASFLSPPYILPTSNVTQSPSVNEWRAQIIAIAIFDSLKSFWHFLCFFVPATNVDSNSNKPSRKRGPSRLHTALAKRADFGVPVEGFWAAARCKGSNFRFFAPKSIERSVRGCTPYGSSRSQHECQGRWLVWCPNGAQQTKWWSSYASEFLKHPRTPRSKCRSLWND